VVENGPLLSRVSERTSEGGRDRGRGGKIGEPCESRKRKGGKTLRKISPRICCGLSGRYKSRRIRALESLSRKEK